MAETRNIQITWRAFTGSPRLINPGPAPEATLSFSLDTTRDDLQLCEQIFQETNTYRGPIWDAIEDLLPHGRTHTALSVIFGRGDYIRINDRLYEVAPIGFTEITGP